MATGALVVARDAHAAITSVSPDSGSTQPGGSTSAEVRVTSGTRNSILTAEVEPAGPQVSFSPANGPPAADAEWTSRMTVSTSGSTAPGDYTVTVIERQTGGATFK